MRANCPTHDKGRFGSNPAVAVLHATIANPTNIRAVIEFPPRRAKYVRLRQLSREGTYAWSLAELEVWSGQ